jgi:tight adherence protein C
MINPLMLRIALGTSAMMTVAGVALMRNAARQRRMDLRLAQVRDGRSAGSIPASQTKVAPLNALRMIAGMGQGILRSGIVSSQTVAALQKSLEGAGIRGRNAVAVFISCKIILAVILPLVLFVMTHNAVHTAVMRNMMLGGAAMVGMLGPDYIVGSLRKRYQTAIAAGLPDTLDMLVMCAESGLSLEPAIQRVGIEIQSAHPAVAGELLLTAGEFQISPDSQAALANLAERTGLPEVKRVVATLSQTLQYGTPLAEALRVLAAEMRQELLTKFEERAARLPVLLTLPMIMFILPSLFLVVGGPAILRAVRLFKH